MNNATSIAHESLDTLLPETRYLPAGFTHSWHCKGGSTFQIRNLLVRHLDTPTHDCWSLEPAPASVNETEWTTLTIGPNAEGGAIFFRGAVIDRFVPSETPGERDSHFMERVAPADYDGMESDLCPARVGVSATMRYLADGSITHIHHRR